MKVPVKVWITVGIIAGIGIGTGFLTIGLLALSMRRNDESASLVALGTTLLAASIAALVAHLHGGFAISRKTNHASPLHHPRLALANRRRGAGCRVVV
jgi:hypothetical protein